MNDLAVLISHSMISCDATIKPPIPPNALLNVPTTTSI
jgi:hypothetical protein